jgi:phage terminase large subunit GpA-like protein
MITTSEQSQLLYSLEEIVEACRQPISDILPSAWAESRRVLTSEESPGKPGPFRYSNSPYTREIVDTLHWSHPAQIISVMKGAQIGFSVSVIENGVGWIIGESPAPTLFLTGHADLADEAFDKLDRMIDGANLRYLIRPTVNRRKNQKTGDTNKMKQFAGGYIIGGSAGNHSLLRQRSVRYIFVDDFENAKKSDKDSGSTRKMIEQRAAANKLKRKIMYISTPELKATSNIEPVFLLGDQRRYTIPCPHCGVFIPIHWATDVEGSDGRHKAGIYYKLDTVGKLIPQSVGYVCQMCSGFFKEKHKYETLNIGVWKPTATPYSPEYTSYHISSLYAGTGMYDWPHYVNEYLQANPAEGVQDRGLMQTFTNLCLGETFEQQGEAPKANQLQKNTRPYAPGTIPEKMSINDGNGKIMLLTLAADLNGTEDDARLDYAITAWSETGAEYHILHGSIGTFIPRENTIKNKEDRPRFTYHHNKQNSVWPLFQEIINTKFKTDTGRNMRPAITGLDCGFHTAFAYSFIDKTNSYVLGLKGKDIEKYVKLDIDQRNFSPSKERGKLYILQVNHIKDDLADKMKLRWDKGNDTQQPPGFINYPTPTDGLYTYNNFYSHYESEQRVIETKDGTGIAATWKKKNSAVQNHFWDVHVYNMAIREIWVHLVTTDAKIPRGTWKDYIELINGKF